MRFAQTFLHRIGWLEDAFCVGDLRFFSRFFRVRNPEPSYRTLAPPPPPHYNPTTNTNPLSPAHHHSTTLDLLLRIGLSSATISKNIPEAFLKPW